jgi:tRNA(Ile)-lysidine synthase
MLSDLVGDFIARHKIKNILLGLSGGLDSIVLLHVLRKLQAKHNFSFRAVHIKHNLQDSASDWDAFCQQQCSDLGVAYLSIDVSVRDISKLGLESAARKARYAAFLSVIMPDEYLVTAQHANDQAETVLTQLIRGCGADGLAAMGHICAIGQNSHARPLLKVTRQDLEAYAASNSLRWVEDPSNADTHYARNAVRHKIIPELDSIRPGVVKTLCRVADNSADAMLCLQDMAQFDAKTVVVSDGVLSISALQQLSAARQRNILRYCCKQFCLSIPGRKHLLQIQTMLAAEPDKMPEVKWGDAIARRYREHLYLQTFSAAPAAFDLQWDVRSDLYINDSWTLSAASYRHLGGDLRVASRSAVGSKLSVRMSSSSRRQLKNCWQDWGVPTWTRDKVPLIIKDSEIVAVPGFLD